MNSRPLSFPLEKTVPGTFVMQGLLGGVVGGFVSALVGSIAWKTDGFRSALDLASYAISFGAITGVVKATCLWGLYRLTGIQMRALARVAVASIASALIVAFLGFVGFEGRFLSGSSIWLLLVGTPVALLVGSRIKPWKIFTFGSIATGNVDQRSGSRSILRTLGTLPLRFLCIAAIALLFLYVASVFSKIHDPDEALIITLFLTIVGSYPLFSAYVTFRSPRKRVLFFQGITINFPVTLVGVIGYRFYLDHDQIQSGGRGFVISVICASFIVAWLIFLVARLSFSISKPLSLNLTNNKSIAAAPDLDHECLGSRFAEWERAA